MQLNNNKKTIPPPLEWGEFVDGATRPYSPDSPTYSPDSPTYSPHSPPVPTTPPGEPLENAFELPHLAEREPIPESPPFVSKIKPRFIPAEPNVPNAFELPHLDDSKNQLSYDGNPITWAPKKKRNNHFVMPHPSNFPQPDFLDIPPPPPPRKFRSTTNPVPADTELSIIIPWAHRNTKEWFVGKTLTDLHWGYIQGINMIYRDRNCAEHWKIFIHFSKLTEDGKKAKDHLMKEKNKEIAIQHKYGTWKIRASNWNFDKNFKNSQNKPRVEFL